MTELTLKDAASALSERNKEVNRSWLLLAAVCFLVVGTSPENGNQVLLGLQMQEAAFFPISIIFVCLLNFHHSVCHIQSIRLGRVLHQKIRESLDTPNNDALPSANTSKEDALHCLYSSTYFRVYPVTAVLKAELRGFISPRIYLWYRQVTVVLLVAFPYFVVFWAFTQMVGVGLSLSQWLWYLAITLPAFALSISGSIARYYADKAFTRLVVRTSIS